MAYVGRLMRQGRQSTTRASGSYCSLRMLPRGAHQKAQTTMLGPPLRDRRRRSARQQHGDLPQHAIDEHADRAVCPLPACDERPFSCSDPCATPTLKAFDPPQLLQYTSISNHMRLYAFTSSSSFPLLAPENQPTSAHLRISKIRAAGLGSCKQQSSRGTRIVILIAPKGKGPSSILSSFHNFVSGLLHFWVLMLTTLFLSIGAVASFGSPRWLRETSSRHQIRTLFIVFLALSPCGATGYAVQQKSRDQKDVDVEPAKTSTATAMMPRTDPQSWEELASAAATASPSATIHLSVSFVMGDFTKEIHFGGKQLVIWGNNATLDAQQKGRFFSSHVGPNDDDDHGPAGKTSLELHDLVMQNGRVDGSGSFQFSSCLCCLLKLMNFIELALSLCLAVGIRTF